MPCYQYCHSLQSLCSQRRVHRHCKCVSMASKMLP